MAASGAAPGRTRPAGPGSSSSHPSGHPGHCQLLPLHPRAAGLRRHGGPQHPLVPSGGAARARGTALTPARRGRGGQTASETPGLPRTGSCGSAVPLPEPGAPTRLRPPPSAAAPSAHSQPWRGPAAGRGRRRALSHLYMSQAAEGLAQAAHLGAETRCMAFLQVMLFNGTKAENPPQVTQALVPSHLTQLFALLQLLLQLKRPAKEGEQKRLFS